MSSFSNVSIFRNEIKTWQVPVSELTIGDYFKEGSNVYIVTMLDDKLYYVNVATGKYCPLHDDTYVYPVDVEISYTLMANILCEE